MLQESCEALGRHKSAHAAHCLPCLGHMPPCAQVDALLASASAAHTQAQHRLAQLADGSPQECASVCQILQQRAGASLMHDDAIQYSHAIRARAAQLTSHASDLPEERWRVFAQVPLQDHCIAPYWLPLARLTLRPGS